MYKLKTTSLSSRFYSWIWKTEITKFKTMCPYFWMYVLTILTLPLILIAKSLYYITPAKKKINKTLDYVSNSKLGDKASKVFKTSRFWDIIQNILKWLFFITFGAMGLFAIGTLCVMFYNSPIKGLAVVGVISILALIVVLLIYLFDECNLGSIIAKPFKLFGNMIYSLYKNICPLISWEK
jgi:hypothetical protein